jgi:glc operon protein GlcG
VKHATSWVLLVLVLAGTSFGQDRPSRLQIKDGAAMFGARAVEQARMNIGADFPMPVIIETIEELGTQTIEEATRRHAEKEGIDGLYVLISRRDHKIDVQVSKAFSKVIPEANRQGIQNGFIRGLQSGNFDMGLMAGIMFISRAPTDAKHAANAAEWIGRQSTTGDSGSSPLVLRSQVRLTLAGAQRILDGAQKKAVEMNLKMNIAVVDDGGHMIAFQRMDGARPASGYTATTKAVTAATFRAPSGPIPAGTTAPDPLLNLSLQNAALASGGKLTTLQGGIPVIVDGQVIGGVGVGGGTGEQDATVARAGVEALEAALKTPADAPKDAPPTEK